MPDIEKILSAMVDAGRKASLAIMDIYRKGFDVTLKEDFSPVTDADLASDGIIRRTLPLGEDIVYLSEEEADDKSRLGKKALFIVDPLDGTFNFQRGQPLTCVSIGLMRGSAPVLGAIYNFNADEMFSGAVGSGVFLNGEKVVPAWASELSQACLMTGFPALADKSPAALAPFIEEIGKFKKIRMIGSAALAVAYVAVGRADVYSEKNTNLWDVAAGMALVKAAGGFVKIEPTGKRALNFNLRCAARAEWL